MDSIPVGYVSELLDTCSKLLSVGDFDAYRVALRNAVKLSGDYPTLGLDIDGVITDFVDVFRVLSNSWPGLVVVVSYRSDYDAAAQLLDDLGIYYDNLFLSPTLDKSDVIRSRKIDVFIDDQDECVKDVCDSVLVLKTRNGGNFADGKWLYSVDTGVLK